MSFNDRLVYHDLPKQMQVARTEVAGQQCPECGGENIRRYPIGWVRGPRIVTKCQDCLHALAVDRPVRADAWPPFRAATYDWEASPAERAAAAARKAS